MCWSVKNLRITLIRESSLVFPMNSLRKRTTPCLLTPFSLHLTSPSPAPTSPSATAARSRTTSASIKESPSKMESSAVPPWFSPISTTPGRRSPRWTRSAPLSSRKAPPWGPTAPSSAATPSGATPSSAPGPWLQRMSPTMPSWSETQPDK